MAQTFALHPEYLADLADTHDEVNFFYRGIQLTRGFRALKLRRTIKVFGLDALRDAIDRTLAACAEQELHQRPKWEVGAPAQLSVVSFRRRWPSASAEEKDRRKEALVAAMTADGRAAISSTKLHECVVLRLCMINPRTTREDIDTTIAALDDLADASRRGARNSPAGTTSGPTCSIEPRSAWRKSCRPTSLAGRRPRRGRACRRCRRPSSTCR